MLKPALFTVKSVVNHFTSNGSVANSCALDLAKAFGEINHFALFVKLMERSVPLAIINVLVHWYSLCAAVVRWDGFLSAEVTLQYGVREGCLQCLLLYMPTL